jgi:prophage antirepressor-like protein
VRHYRHTQAGDAPELFEFRGRSLRTAGTWDAPLFHLADLCGLLGLKGRRGGLDADDVVKATVVGPRGGRRQHDFVTEAGLWKLARAACTANAKPALRWVTGTVLPFLRRAPEAPYDR